MTTGIDGMKEMDVPEAGLRTARTGTVAEVS